MAWARKRATGWTGNYRAEGKVRSVKAPDGTPLVFSREVDARNAGAEQELRIGNDDWVDPDRTRVLLRDYAASWLKGKAKIRPRTAINIEGRLRNHILPSLGSARVGAIRPADV